MSNNNIIISNYPSNNNVVDSDKVLVLKQSPLQEYWVPIKYLLNNTNTLIQNYISPNSNITVTAGVILYDQNYIYIAVANNTLKRVALTEF